MTLAVSVLLASLLGSVHCAAMCGGFVCLYAGGTRGAATHVAYNGGRLASYLFAGAVAGFLGSALERAGIVLGVARLAAVVSGALLVLWGTALALKALGVRLPAPAGPSFLLRLTGPVLSRTRRRSPVVRAGATGLLSALLPCGWLYAFVATAGGTGSVAGAMGLMAFFWLGTVPALLAVGYGLQRLTGPLRARLPLVTAMAVVVIGALSLFGRLRPPAGAGAHAHQPMARPAMPTTDPATATHGEPR